jgi:hypothetical protein
MTVARLRNDAIYWTDNTEEDREDVRTALDGTFSLRPSTSQPS